jgi:hypothetical protein
VLFCNSGFRQVSWLNLIDKHCLGYVVRLVDDVHVEWRVPSVALSGISLGENRLGFVPVRSVR